MKKKNVNFEDVVYFQEGPGVRNWQFRDSGIKLINIRNLVDSELCLENTTNYLEIEEVENKYKHFLLNAGDFVMASSGVTWGKIAEVHEEHLPLCLNTSIIRLVSKDTDVLDKWYLYYYIKSPQFRRQIERLITGSAQPNFGPSHLKKVIINLPEIDNQREAVEQFTKVETVINERQKEMELLDNLIKARFVEMFGDLIVNPMKWEEMNISRVVGGKVSNGFFAKRDDYCEDGNVSVLGVAHVVNRMYSNYEGLPKTKGTETDIKKFAVKYGDLLFCRSSLVAEGIGKASAVPKGVPYNTLFECHVIRLPLDLKKVVPEYLQVLTTMDYFRNQIIAQSKTATMTTIGQDGILKCNILLPPIDLQKEFLVFINQINKSKVMEIKKSYEPINNSFYYKYI